MPTDYDDDDEDKFSSSRNLERRPGPQRDDDRDFDRDHRREYDDDSDDYRRGRRRYREPHRASVVLVFGILGLLMCGLLGIFAWVMGSKDLQAMEEGRMDPEGKSLTKSGYVLGIVSTIIGIIQTFMAIFYAIFIVAMIGKGR